ncbi:MFS general substrate transporter [Calocera cornea HHB12733]|uniref:MFS general substrate transporter n=1 Tax=Calocera cornea HHB12733 TaxID=1353952 RepID=A0A165K0C2_9BASI|nr:MFS general substrate transporter [Calocera cornea HHB12733]
MHLRMAGPLRLLVSVGLGPRLWRGRNIVRRPREHWTEGRPKSEEGRREEAAELAVVEQVREGHTAPEGDADAVQSDQRWPVMTKMELQLMFIASIIGTAMPTIASQFDSLSQQQWISLAYLLTSTVFQPLFGRATDLWGSRSVFFVTIFFSEFGNFIWLCCARAIAGAGAGGLAVVIMVVISQMVSLRECPKYMGIVYVRLVVSTVFGPPNITWWDIDFGGVALLACFTVSLALAFNWGGVVHAWNSPLIIVLLVVRFVLAFGFVLWEVKVAPFPLIPMNRFMYRDVTAGVANNFFSSVSLQGILLYIPSYYQIVRKDSQIISGLDILPYVVPLLATSTIIGRVITKTGRVREYLWLGELIDLVGTGLLTLVDGRYPRAVEYVLHAMAGTGAGLLMQTITLSVQSAVTKDLIATATTMTLWSRRLGIILSAAIQGSILSNTFKKGILASAAAAPYVNQLLAADNVTYLPPEVQVAAEQSYGTAFQMMMVATPPSARQDFCGDWPRRSQNWTRPPPTLRCRYREYLHCTRGGMKLLVYI